MKIANLALLAPVLGFILAGAVQAEDLAPSPGQLPKGTRELIFNQEGTPTQNLAVHIEVELKTPEGWVPVPGMRVFNDGEKIRFAFTPTLDAFAYLLCKNSDGSRAMLWPSIEAGTISFVNAGRRITVPQFGSEDAGWIFTPPAGQEEIVLILSGERIPEFETIATQVQDHDPDQKMLTKKEFEVAEAACKQISTKNLFFVPDENESPQPGGPGYVGTPNPNEPLKVSITLAHGAAPVPVGN
jgi:hypothetical protein